MANSAHSITAKTAPRPRTLDLAMRLLLWVLAPGSFTAGAGFLLDIPHLPTVLRVASVFEHRGGPYSYSCSMCIDNLNIGATS